MCVFFNWSGFLRLLCHQVWWLRMLWQIWWCWSRLWLLWGWARLKWFLFSALWTAFLLHGSPDSVLSSLFIISLPGPFSDTNLASTHSFCIHGCAIHKRPTSKFCIVCAIMVRTHLCLVGCFSGTAILLPAHSYTSGPFTNGSIGDGGERVEKICQ